MFDPYLFPWPRSGFPTFLILESPLLRKGAIDTKTMRSGAGAMFMKKSSGIEAASILLRLRNPAVGSKQIENILLSSYCHQ